MRKIELKLIPGDGVGKEVVGESKRIFKKIEEIHGGVSFELDEVDWGCEYYLKNGRMMPEDGLDILSQSEAILLGAVGFPGVEDHVSVRGLLFPIRQQFEQYINMRPIRLLDGLDSPLKATDIDFMVVRENSEGEYCGKGRYINPENPDEGVVQEAWFTEKGTSRVIRYAFEYAKKTGKKNILSATKSNALNYSMVFWDKVYNRIAGEYEGINTRSMHIDALTGLFIMKPEQLEVVVASNLFGDILTDLGSAMLGSIGISPSANINPEKKYPSMFEPIHGSAPDIAGRGLANPIGTVWSIAMMLEHLGLPEMKDIVVKAMEKTLSGRKVRTPDLGGTSTTAQVVDEICRNM